MKLHVALFSVVCLAQTLRAAPAYLDDQFDLPKGFRIYRAATAEFSGGSYDLCFDGAGRLLVGDGNAVRRLIDKDQDGVFDGFEVIASGLGWRGPQGLLVYGDRLYAVGGDGLQLFEGYNSAGGLVHKGRVGNKFNTGGDHEAHTVLRGHDGFIYLNVGDGGGAKDRLHITEETSPIIRERAASVFRISPDGSKWECISAGGRNPPNLGLNYLGDFFSLDSDMEWHVGLPWYRPVRLNHWAIGGDQGWQEVGAYPPYYVDCLPSILDVGRGSPDWGIFYEHNQFPKRYQNAYLVCDYRWKRESSDDYNTTGRLLAFYLHQNGAGWKADMEVLAKPKANARDSNGKPLSFALVDIDVAPDGSIYLSDHNQGIWRIVHTETNNTAESPDNSLEGLLRIPQPGSEWARLQQEQVLTKLGCSETRQQLMAYTSASKNDLPNRLRALRFLSPEFQTLSAEFLKHLAGDPSPQIRGQIAWLLGIRNSGEGLPTLLNLLEDADGFVRRRAAEALTRYSSRDATEAVVDHLADSSRLVRYICTTALARQPLSQWWDKAELRSHPQVRLRAVVAATIGRHEVPTNDLRQMIVPLLTQKTLITEDRLDLLRIINLAKTAFQSDRSQQQIINYLLRRFPETDRDVRWEQIRLLGEFGVTAAFPQLLGQLESEKDPVTQFHIAQALSKLDSGWNTDQEKRLTEWLLATQRGWFADFGTKGVEFPLFWSTVLSELGTHHRDALLARREAIDLASLLGGTLITLIAEGEGGTGQLMSLYRSTRNDQARLRIIKALRKAMHPDLPRFLRQEYDRAADKSLSGAILQALASQLPHAEINSLFIEGLTHQDREVARTCAIALAQSKPTLDRALAETLVSQIDSRRETFHANEKLLSTVAARNRPGFHTDTVINRRVDDATWSAAKRFWKQWYQEQFGDKIETKAERTDDDLHRAVLRANFDLGNGSRGGAIYESLQCHTCHGGGINPGREGKFFGPDVAGVTRRLSRPELADALVFPSKQVPDRYKAFELQLRDETTLIGFLTDTNDLTITFAAQDEVRKVARNQVKDLRPQTTSLMPDRLLNGLSDSDVADLLAFLDRGPAAKKRE